MENTDTVRQSNTGLIVGLIVLLLVLPLCCMAVLCGSLALGLGAFVSTSVDVGALGDIESLEDIVGVAGVPATEDYRAGFPVDGTAHLDVDVKVGSVTVVVGDDESIEVAAEITAYGDDDNEAEEALDRVELDVVPSKDALQITGTWPQAISVGKTHSPKIDLTVTVPEETELEITMEVGTIKVTGTDGDVDIKCNVGEIVLRDVVVKRNAVIETDVASVDFRGALTDGATYEITSDVGEITMRLPEDSGFAIDATSDVGDVNVTFDVDGETSRKLMTKTVNGVVGADDNGVRLILTSNVGSITVRPM